MSTATADVVGPLGDGGDGVPEEGVERGRGEDVEVGEAMEPGDKQLWSDASKLLFQLGYLKVLKNMALSGQLQQYNIRSVVWRLFLHILPEDQTQWESATMASRKVYSKIKQKHVMDPHLVTVSLDIALNNPLSQNEDSPWNRFFQDNELRQLVNQDVVRTFPDVQFFRQDHIQQIMEDILFCYVREHEELGYRQGMHELLAPILFIMHAEMRDMDDPSLAPALRVVMDTNYIEHDTYAIFSEVMEMVEPWYNTTGLEADQVKARQQASSAKRKNMTRDPRVSTPFNESDIAGPASAISRKLDVVHDVLLKKADEVLYVHLKQLSIPAQTYGIRWIRLLFGREFPLPSVLEVWDAVFADGVSLVDYMCVAMLMHIREVLIEGDYAVCMHHLMHFPTVYEVNYLIQRSLHLRNPSSHPSPRLWSYHPNHNPHQVHTTPLPRLTSPTSQQPLPTQQQQQQLTSRAKLAGAKAKHVLSTATKQLAPGRKRRDGEGKTGTPPPREQTSPTPPFPTAPSLPGTVATTTTTKESKKGRGKIIGEINEPKEMKNNPKMHSPLSTSLSQLDRLTSRVDDLEAKLSYCGSKMDSLLMAMETEVSDLTDQENSVLSPETENTLLISLAGLKQVRDILLNKILFSGAMLKDEHNVIVHRQDDTLNGAHPLQTAMHAPTSQLSQEHVTLGSNGGTSPSDRTEEEVSSTAERHPLMSSTEESGRDGEDWVHLSTSHGHPLVSSDS